VLGRVLRRLRGGLRRRLRAVARLERLSMRGGCEQQHPDDDREDPTHRRYHPTPSAKIECLKHQGLHGGRSITSIRHRTPALNVNLNSWSSEVHVVPTQCRIATASSSLDSGSTARSRSTRSIVRSVCGSPSPSVSTSLYGSWTTFTSSSPRGGSHPGNSAA